MKLNLRPIVAVAAAILAIVWGVTTVQQQSYSGTELAFPIGSGAVVVNNSGEAAAQARLTSTGTRGAFTVVSSAEETPVASVREGTGRNVVNAVMLDLPPGTTELTLTRGSSVSMNISGQNPIDVVVNPQSSNEQNTTLIIAAVIVVGALAYALFTTRASWMRLLRSRGTDSAANANEAASAI